MGVKSVKKYSINEHIFGKNNILKILDNTAHRDKCGRAVYTVLNKTTNEIYKGIKNKDIKRIAESNKKPFVVHVDDEFHTIVEWNKILGLSNMTLQMYYIRHGKDMNILENHIRDLLKMKK